MHPVKADLRQEITGFGLLDWAYRKECVRAAGEEEWAALEGHGMSILARAGNVGLKGMSHGAINGRLDVHIDALRVDKFVYDNCSSKLYWHVTVNAEAGRPVPATLALPRVTRCSPRYHENNLQRLVKTYDKDRHWVACEVEYDAPSDEEVSSALKKQAWLHGQYLALLDALPELALDKWKVTDRGA
jgi:hypothetical protein